jgi:hypothetical protein
MPISFALAFSTAIFASGSSSPIFAEEVPNGIGSTAVFELALDRHGQVTTCAFSGMNELTREAKPIDSTPSGAYISDACRKLSSQQWRPQMTQAGEVLSTYYACRYLELTPDFAYCERRFGE